MADSQPMSLLESGSTFAQHFLVEHELGRGAMGVVYRAIDARTHTLVAIKVLYPHWQDEASLRRFQTEAAAASALDHEHIVKCFEVGCEEGLHYLIMEYVDGPNVQELVQAEGRLSEERARQIASDVLMALHAAHTAGIVHRDIKSPNILLASDGTAKLTDFGVARVVEGSRLTSTGAVLGTPEYMSPEQCQGQAEPDGRADLYSLGVVLFEMVTGQLPFHAEATVAFLMKHVEEAPPNPRDLQPKLSRQMDAVILTALVKQPAGRFADATEMLAAVQGRRRVRRPREGRLRPTRIRLTRMQRAMALSAALLLATMALAGVVWGRNKQSEAQASETERELAERQIAEDQAAKARLAATLEKERAQNGDLGRSNANCSAKLEETSDLAEERMVGLNDAARSLRGMEVELNNTQSELDRAAAENQRSRQSLASTRQTLTQTESTLRETQRSRDRARSELATCRSRKSSLSGDLTRTKNALESEKRRHRSTRSDLQREQSKASQFRRALINAYKKDDCTLVAQVKSSHPNIAYLGFYLKGAPIAWPGGGRHYVLDDYDVHTYRLGVRSGDTVCYGAYNATGTWGTGKDGDGACTSCCWTCTGSESSTGIQNLLP